MTYDRRTFISDRQSAALAERLAAAIKHLNAVGADDATKLRTLRRIAAELFPHLTPETAGRRAPRPVRTNERLQPGADYLS